MSILRAFSSLDEATNERVSYHQTGTNDVSYVDSHLLCFISTTCVTYLFIILSSESIPACECHDFY